MHITTLFLALLFCADNQKPKPEPAPKDPAEPVTLDARFIDGSVLKLVLREESLGLITPYGRLVVPVSDVRRIEFATRVPADVAKRVEALIADLENPQFPIRKAAAAELLKFKEKAYPALLKTAEKAAERGDSPETARRVEELLEQLHASLPAERLDQRANDVVYTENSKLTGRLEAETFKATSGPLGDLTVKLSDLRRLRHPDDVDETEAVVAAADPGSLGNFANQVGKVLAFRVTGNPNGSVWGTNVYTSDSQLATAAVHAGVLKPGQTGVVRVKIVPAPAAFTGSTRNGVASSSFGPYPGAFQILR